MLLMLPELVGISFFPLLGALFSPYRLKDPAMQMPYENYQTNPQNSTSFHAIFWLDTVVRPSTP
jgi:hypothetical protein